MQTEEQTQPPASSNEPKPKKKREVTRREILFVEHLLTGITCSQAAQNAGWSKETGESKSSKWIATERENSVKPHLWDYYQKRLNQKLRILDANSTNIIRELAIVGFSSIDKFIDFPSRQDAINEMMADRISDAKNREFMKIATEEDKQILADNDENDSNAWKKYRPGALIKLKSIEDIPAELFPAVAEIHETKDGIRIKLHNKLDALDKLSRILKLYSDEKTADEVKDFEINIVVNGSKSPLMLPPVAKQA